MTALSATRAALLPPPAGARAPLQYSLGFAVFLLLNATLFVRPAEIVPDLLGLEIYLGLIVLCFMMSFPAVLAQLTPGALDTRPTTVCVFGIGAAMVLSHLTHGEFVKAADDGFDFAKVLLYYFLFLGLVTSPGRIRTYVTCFVLFAAVVVTLAILQYHGAITLPNLNPIKDDGEDKNNKDDTVVRLVGTGLFQDPNDLCSLLVVSILLGLYCLTNHRAGATRFAFVLPLGLFLYALALTQSRGGMLALLAGLFAFLCARFGTRAGLSLGALLMPVLLVVFAGRQTNLSTTSGTSQERIQLWSDALAAFRSAPLLGIGRGAFAKTAGLVAHNSYLHTFAELGFLGGTCFVGAFWIVLAALGRLGAGRRILDPDLRHLYPYLLGAIAGYATGMMSLTLVYILPTYSILALATVYLGMVRTDPPAAAMHLDARLVQRMVLASVCCLAGLYVFVRIFVNRV